MGFVTQFFIKPAKSELMQPLAGSFTVTREGQIGTSTLPHSFPGEHVKLIADAILAAFRGAKKSHLPLSELSVEYSLLKFVAYDIAAARWFLWFPTRAKAMNGGKSPCRLPPDFDQSAPAGELPDGFPVKVPKVKGLFAR